MSRITLWNEFANVINGVSRVVLRSELEEQFLKKTKYASLFWTTEGPRRPDTTTFRGMIKYNWEFEPKETGRKIVSIQSTGMNQNYARSELKKNRPIRKDIRKYHKDNFKYCCLCCELFERLKGKIVIDHKDDSYSDSNVCGKDGLSTQKKRRFSDCL